MKIIFSELAIATLQEIVDFLQNKWTEKQLAVLENDIENFVGNIQNNYKIYKISDIDETVREALIGNKMVKIFFEIKDENAHILLFWNNKGDSRNLIKFIKNRI